MSASIAATGLQKDYAGERALGGVTFVVPEGTLFGIIGADGAGKTTLMQILTTLIRPDGGSASVLGLDIGTREHRERIRTSVGYMPQRFSLYHDLTVLENLRFFADIFGVIGPERGERIARLLAFARLEPFTARRAAHLSGGMKQKLSLCCALIHRPALLFLDEPTVGVDPASRREFWAILRELVGEGHTILIATPYMDESEYCGRLAFIHRGAVVGEGTPREFIDRYPLDLHEIRGDFEPQAVTVEYPLPLPCIHCYHAGGEMRAACAKGTPAAELLAGVRRIVPRAAALAPVTPRMEDVFIHLLAG